MDRLLTRSESARPPMHQLPTVQRQIVEAVSRYEAATGEPCPGRYLARRFGLHHKTVQTHIGALHRKGWFASPGAPVRLAGDRR